MWASFFSSNFGRATWSKIDGAANPRPAEEKALTNCLIGIEFSKAHTKCASASELVETTLVVSVATRLFFPSEGEGIGHTAALISSDIRDQTTL